MAFRKATMKQQVAEAVAQQAPGDRALVTLATVTGPTPWVSVGLLGLIGQFLVKYYFVTVTDQALLLHRMNRWNQRPKEIAHAIPRDQAQALFREVQLNPLWSFFHITLPDKPQQPTRVNVHRMWRNELEQLLATLGGTPQPYGQPQQAPQPYGQQQPYAAQPPQQPYAQPQQAPQPQQQYGQPSYGQQPPPQQPYAPQQQPYAPQPPQQPYGQPQQPPAQPPAQPPGPYNPYGG